MHVDHTLKNVSLMRGESRTLLENHQLEPQFVQD